MSGDDPVPRGIAVRRTAEVTLATSISSLSPTSVFSEVFLGRRPMAQKRQFGENDLRSLAADDVVGGGFDSQG